MKLTIFFLLMLFISSSIYCIDADIYIETLTLSTSTETQGRQKNTENVPAECVWEASIKCRAQIRAFRFAPEHDYQAKAKEARECLLSHPCALRFKKSDCLS